MIRLNYYHIESGWNYCLIRKKEVELSYRRMMLLGLKKQAKFILSLYWKRIKKQFKDGIHFKVVYVDKVHVRWMNSCIIVADNYDDEIEPDLSSDEYDIYVMEPGHELQLEYSVKVHEIEHRSIKYEDMIDPSKG